MIDPALAQARIVDAAGIPVHLAGDDGQRVTLRYADGAQVSVPVSMLERRNDGSLLLPLVVHPENEDVSVRVPVAEERLHVAKRTAERGGVQVRKIVHTHEEPIAQSLASERVEIERVPRDLVLQDANTPAVREEGDTLVIPVLEERLVVHKQLVLKEELHVRRVKSERTEQRSVTLKSEQVDVTRVSRRQEDGDEQP